MSYPLPDRDAPRDEQHSSIDEVIDRTRDGDTLDNAVYVLNCQAPSNKSQLQSLKNQADISGQVYDDEALVADHLYYVGWSNRPVYRILAHLRASQESARFTKIYPPVAIEEIRWFDSKKEAKRKEPEVADEYRNMTVDLQSLDQRDDVDREDGIIEWYEIVQEIKEFDERTYAYSL